MQQHLAEIFPSVHAMHCKGIDRLSDEFGCGPMASCVPALARSASTQHVYFLICCRSKNSISMSVRSF